MHSDPRRSPGYQALADDWRQQIQTGVLRAGDRLPTFAELHRRYGVARGTVDKAHSLLDAEGLIERCQGSGIFVAETPVKDVDRRIGFYYSEAEKSRIHPYWAHILAGVREGARSHGLEVAMLPESSARVAKERVSGAVIASHDPAKVRVEHSLEFPAVYLLTAVEGRSAVLVDDYGGGWRAAEMLIEFGHRRIAFLILPGPIIAARVNGYRDALELAGIQVEDAWIRSISAQWTSDDHVSGGRRGMTAWLHDGWRELGCTAIVVFNDSVAIGAMQALQAAGISVPGDVSVIGFDGTEICQHVFPALTSVRIPLDELGRAAVNLLSGLLELAAGKPLDPQIVTLPVEIAMGGTVAPPRDRL